MDPEINEELEDFETWARKTIVVIQDQLNAQGNLLSQLSEQLNLAESSILTLTEQHQSLATHLESLTIPTTVETTVEVPTETPPANSSAESELPIPVENPGNTVSNQTEPLEPSPVENQVETPPSAPPENSPPQKPKHQVLMV